MKKQDYNDSKKSSKVNSQRGKRSGGSKAKTKGTNSDNLRSTSNDPAWYSVDPVILRDAASFPFAHPAGHPVKLGREDMDTSFTIPGVMAMDLMPTIGYSVDASSPVNIAATQSYAFIRHGNSGSVNYDAGDIMLYYLGMADVYSYIEYLKRIYGVAQLYAQRNRYMPYTLLRAMKVDPVSVEYNMANFRLGINMLINKAASFAVPNTMSVFNRRAFLYQNLYTEGDSVKDQLYCFTPGGFQVYAWTESKLQTVRFTPADVYEYLGETTEAPEYFDVTTLLKFGNRMIDLIISNEDLGTMNGDILKVYGDNIIKLAHLDEAFVTVPLKDQIVLEQFHNASVLQFEDVSVFDVTSEYVESGDVQGVSILKSEPCVTVQVFASGDAGVNSDAGTRHVKNATVATNMLKAANVFATMNNKLLTTDVNDVSPEIIMELTRLVPVCGVSANSGRTGTFYVNSGTEIPVNLTIWLSPSSMSDKGSSCTFASASLKADTIWGLVNGPDEQEPYIIKTIMEQALYPSQMCSAFKYAPIRVLFDHNKLVVALMQTAFSKVDMPGADGIEGNVCNYTVITPEQVAKLHAVAMLNEFATPHVAILK